MTENKYKSYRILDGKPRWIILDVQKKIINKNPKEELIGLEKEPFKRKGIL